MYEIVRLHVYNYMELDHRCLWCYPLPNDNILDLSKLEAFADDKIIAVRKTKNCFWKCRKHCGNRRKRWFPSFSPFPTMFSKDVCYRVVKSPDCVV